MPRDVGDQRFEPKSLSLMYLISLNHGALPGARDDMLGVIFLGEEAADSHAFVSDFVLGFLGFEILQTYNLLFSTPRSQKIAKRLTINRPVNGPFDALFTQGYIDFPYPKLVGNNRISHVDSLWKMSFTLKDVFDFIQHNMRPVEDTRDIEYAFDMPNVFGGANDLLSGVLVPAHSQL